MSKINNIEMQNAVYGVQNEIVQAAIRRAHRERAEAISELVRKIFRRGDADEAAHKVDLNWKSLSSSGV